MVCAPWKKIRKLQECPVCKRNKHKTNNALLVEPKKKGVKRVLALDQATHLSGWSIYDGQTLIRYGTFETNQNDEIERIVTTFLNKEAVDDFSVAVTYDEIKEKGYSLSAGQYFDIKIDYLDITEEEFNKRMTDYKNTLTQQFEESHRLEAEIMKQLENLGFNNVTR